MQFVPLHLRHRQRVPWNRISHVRLRPGATADTAIGHRILSHIRLRADKNRIAALKDIQPDFPVRQKHLEPLVAMRVDLRHMANERDSGSNEENKGLIELGWFE
jgi:hypothetical protein